MVLNAIGQPLQLEERPDPIPGPGEIRVPLERANEAPEDLRCGRLQCAAVLVP